MQQGGHEAQVSRHRRLQREQREDALVYLQVAPVDAIVIGDHHLGQLDVLVVERLEHAVELLDHDVDAAEGVLFERRQLFLEVDAAMRGPSLAIGALGRGRARRREAPPASRTCR